MNHQINQVIEFPSKQHFVEANKMVSAAPLPAPTELAATRLLICVDCEQYSNGSCRLAGCCNKSLALKVTWQLSRCPLNPPKW